MNKLVSIFAVTLVVWLCSACADSSSVDVPEEPHYSEPGYISFTLQSRDKSTKKRAVEADSLVQGTTAEDAIHEVRIWVFNSATQGDAATPIAYKCETLDDPESSYTMFVKVPGGNLQNVDIYAVVNADSGTSVDAYTDADAMTLTRGDLHQAEISGMFGVNSPGKPQTSGVPSTGLPMSGEVLNVNLNTYKYESATEAMANPVTLNVKRCVTKVHFFFAYRNIGALADAQIVGAKINSEVVPTQMALFESGRSYLTGLSYYPYSVNYDDVYTTSKMTALTIPSTYEKQDGETAQAYVDRLKDAGFKERYLTYLMESDRALTGEIYYKFFDDDITRTATFAFPAGEMLRNHDCIVYCYFQDGHIYVTAQLLYQVVPWESAGTFDIEFD